jgi:hypothetical protein
MFPVLWLVDERNKGKAKYELGVKFRQTRLACVIEDEDGVYHLAW